MKNCSFCDRTLKFWQFKCNVCSRYNWGPPQIILIIILLMGFIGLSLLVIDYFAVNQVPPEQKEIDVRLPRDRRRY